jgi:hypothetical protein
MGKNDGTNGPYAWGNGPKPQGKSLLGKIVKKLVDLATEPGKGGKK